LDGRVPPWAILFILSVSTTYSIDEFELGVRGFTAGADVWVVVFSVSCRGDGLADDLIVSNVCARPSAITSLRPRSRSGTDE
jgi:hypothetical protein